MEGRERGGKEQYLGEGMVERRERGWWRGTGAWWAAPVRVAVQVVLEHGRVPSGAPRARARADGADAGGGVAGRWWPGRRARWLGRSSSAGGGLPAARGGAGDRGRRNREFGEEREGSAGAGRL